MQLRIRKIVLKNFKVFEEMTIYPNNEFNIIIGENSSGKSSIFEALHLWEKCYQTYILASRKGFYKVRSTANRYVNYQDLDFLRITTDDDLFYDPKQSKCAEITLVLTSSGTEYDLGFKITSPASIENAFFRVQPIDQDQFSIFAQAFTSTGKFLDEAVFIYQTRPVSGVHQYEPYYNDAQVKKRIQKGLSHEVLRNKIVSKRESIQQLEVSISEILEKSVKFNLPSKAREKKDEFVSVKVSVDGSKNYDLHLQGSGFLQIVEILSTIEFIDAPLKLLLVDEPDSHIHSKLQQNLISHLRNIDSNQFFVISHNDQFVVNASDNEIFYLSEDSKNAKELKPVPPKGFDTIKSALGGVILSLDALSRASSIIFVEGKNDESYLKALAKKYALVNKVNDKSNDFKFFPLRGKDNIKKKIEYNKRTLSELFLNKRWITIFDRDFSTTGIDKDLTVCIEKIMGQGSFAYSHDGYCIESVLFSDIGLLKSFLTRNNPDINQLCLESAIDEVTEDIRNNVKSVTSDIYTILRGAFSGQKFNRPEFEKLDFDEVVKDWYSNGQLRLQFAMNKSQINLFVQQVEEKVDCSICLRNGNSDEAVAAALLLTYIDSIASANDIYPTFTQLITQMRIAESAA